MPGLVSFSYTRDQLFRGGKVEPVGQEAATPDERLIFLGQQNSVSTLPDDLRFEAIGAVPVPCRSSVVRLAFMKLLGTGILVGATGFAASDVGIASSCALAFAVNSVACAHYLWIWRVRAQAFGDTPYKTFMIGVGRGENFKDEVAKNAQKLHAQELSIDGLRHSDWAVTLVLMMIDLHALAEKASPTRTPYMIRELTAFLQVWIISFGSIGRFFANECRRDAEGKWPSLMSKGGMSLIAGAFSYIVAFGIWVLTTWTVIDHVGAIEDVPTLLGQRDATAVYVVMLSQIGYPLVALLQVLWLNFGAGDLRDAAKPWRQQRPMPGNQYSPWLSFVKDLAFASLDVTSKGGLAAYCALRATWVTPEAYMVLANSTLP